MTGELTKLANTISGGAIWPTPDMSVLGDTIPCAPRFPIECMGNSSDYIQRAAAGANVNPDYVAAMLIAAAGGLVGKCLSVRVSSDWFEPLIFWSVMVGPPSSGKTPACKAIRRTLQSLQAALASRHRDRVEQEIIDAKKDGEPNAFIDRLKDKLEEPPRYVVNDSTAEALARIEARSHSGLLVERDELAGLIEGLERYSAGVDRAYYLEAFNDGPFTLDRVKAGNLSIPNHTFCIAGGIQPDRMRSLLTHSGDDDGFMARLLVFWPDLRPAGPVPKGADHAAMETALGELATLAELYQNDPHTLTMTAAAFDAFNDWYQKENAERRGIQGKIGSAYGKLAGYAARLSGALHVLDWAFDPVSNEPPRQIEERHVVAALAMIERYFVIQLQRAYYGAELSPEEATAAAILHEAKARKLRTLNLRTARREWSIRGARGKSGTTLFQSAATLLEESNWLRLKPTQGRSIEYEINPTLCGGK